MSRFRESAVVARSPEDTFAFITDQSRIGEWNDHVQHAEVVGGGPVTVGSVLRQHRRRNNREFDLEFVVIVHDPPTRHVVTGSVFGVATTMTFEVEPAEGGSRVTMLADVRGRGLSVLWAPIVAREMRRSTVAALSELSRVLGVRPEG